MSVTIGNITLITATTSENVKRNLDSWHSRGLDASWSGIVESHLYANFMDCFENYWGNASSKWDAEPHVEIRDSELTTASSNGLELDGLYHSESGQDSSRASQIKIEGILDNLQDRSRLPLLQDDLEAFAPRPCLWGSTSHDAPGNLYMNFISREQHCGACSAETAQTVLVSVVDVKAFSCMGYMQSMSKACGQSRHSTWCCIHVHGCLEWCVWPPWWPVESRRVVVGASKLGTNSCTWCRCYMSLGHYTPIQGCFCSSLLQ